MNDSLGDRMKNNYENVTRYYLPKRTYTIIRIDGKSFHTFTKNYDRPYDLKLMDYMDNTALFLCENIQGCKLAYVQSDEISLVLTDFDTLTTEGFFTGNIQKICSISASMATARFNELLEDKSNLAFFDSRVFTIPSRTEVCNYFIWRQQDAVRNSIQMASQSLFSHRELQHKNTSTLQEMMFSKGVNWNDYPIRFKRGGCVVKKEFDWWVVEPPIFTQEQSWLRKYIIEDNN